MQSIHRYPTDDEAKKLIVDIGRRMYQKNFVAANDGNISCKVDDDIIWTTPTGVSKGFMSEDMMVKMRLDGTVLSQGERVLVAINAAAEPYTAHFNANAGRATDLITGNLHDFGGGSELAPYSAAFWRTE